MSYAGKLLLILMLGATLIISCEEDSETTNEPVINTNPVISIISPINDDKIADFVEIEAEATDDKGIYKVDFYIDGERVGADPAPPYLYIWDASQLENGSGHSIFAIAYDTDDNMTASSPIYCTIDTTLAIPDPVLVFIDQGITSSSIPIYWERSGVNDFSSYILRYDMNSVGDFEGAEINIYDVFDTTYVMADLMDTAEYRFQVVVKDVQNHVSIGNIEFATTLNSPPPQPVVTSGVKLVDRVKLIWTMQEIVDFQKYEIIRSIDDQYDFADEIIATVIHFDSTIYNYYNTDTGIYYYFVVAYDESGLSTTSESYDVNQDFVNYALKYNGATYCTVPFFDKLNVGDTYSLEAWIFQTEYSTYMRVIDKSPTGHPYLQYSLISDNAIGADICGDWTPQRFHASVGVALNEWHHVALTYNNGFIVYYIDGQPVDTTNAAITSTCGFSTTLNIGRRKMFDEFYFKGLIDEVRVWDDVRTEVEINSSYKTRLNGTESGLVSYFGFDEGEGQTIFSPVGLNGFLGVSTLEDVDDPLWVESTSPIQ